jgi:hypothetical protein
MVDPGRERSQPDHSGRQVPQIFGWMWVDHPSGWYEEVFFKQNEAPKIQNVMGFKWFQYLTFI